MAKTVTETQPKTSAPDEVAVLLAVIREIDSLDEGARTRVIRYLMDRFQVYSP